MPKKIRGSVTFQAFETMQKGIEEELEFKKIEELARKDTENN